LAVPAAQAAAPVKVIVTGPEKSGKTTFVRTIADMTVQTQEPHPRGKGMIAIDFGRITLGKDLVIYLYGTRTQEELKALWEAWKEGMLGFILVVRLGDVDTLDLATEYFRYFVGQGDWPFLVVINAPKDEVETPSQLESERSRVAEALGIADLDFVTTADARNRQEVKAALLDFLSLAISPKRANAIAWKDASASSA
jgi:signal recognition particle receptor subunit beta